MAILAMPDVQNRQRWRDRGWTAPPRPLRGPGGGSGVRTETERMEVFKALSFQGFRSCLEPWKSNRPYLFMWGEGKIAVKGTMLLGSILPFPSFQRRRDREISNRLSGLVVFAVVVSGLPSVEIGGFQWK